MNYSKKQMQPLIDKYGINPQTNKLFISICEMFDGRQNYQIWAVKLIFSQKMTFEELDKIHSWIETKSNFISSLEKNNIVSYNTKSSISQLFKEMEGIDRMTFVKSIISHFNTDQRKILNNTIFPKEYTPLEAYFDGTLKKWYKALFAFNKKPMSVKNNFYSNCSMLKNEEELHKAILNCLKDGYEWKAGKEDLISFIEYNARDCEIVFNEGPCVVVKVPSFNSSQKLCGDGRTGWCISLAESYFNSYITSYSNRTQYFLFDFSRRETDAFAHVGFTVEEGKGIVEAQTGHNHPMKTNKFTQGDEEMDIYDVLKKNGVDKRLFLSLPKDIGFEWNIKYFLKLANSDKESFAVAYNKNGILVLNVLNYDAICKLLKKTYALSKFLNHYDTIGANDKIYLVLNFNVPINASNSLVLLGYQNDTFGIDTFKISFDIYGEERNKVEALKFIGIPENVFLGKEKIDPSILLHKLISENDEIGAIKLIQEEKDNIDVNYPFENKAPIFSVMNNHMIELFKVLINHKNFKSSINNQFGETLLGSLIFLYGSDDVLNSNEEKEFIKNAIDAIISNDNFDLNEKDINEDTALNLACCFPRLLWVVEKLASKKEVNVNNINDFNCSAFSTCIRKKNIDALRIIGKRPDLVVREKDIKLAKEAGINLNDFIAPTEDIFKVSKESEKVMEHIFSIA